MKFQIYNKKQLNAEVFSMEIHAPRVAKKAKAGQFIILRVSENGERVPLTIAGTDGENVRIIFQAVGKSTIALSKKENGECLQDFVGPLGVATHLPESGRVAVIGGGLGAAICLPQALALAKKGVTVDVVLGFRNKDLIILEDEFEGCDLHITTDDKGFVTDEFKKLIETGAKYDLVIAIGPLPMMKAVCEITKELGIKTIVSMNSTMVDGTGMCGGCRVTIGGEVKFACVDGPDFDGHLVDFDEAMMRAGIYKKEEHKCRMGVKSNA